ncbi:MAG: hypothetical protein H0T04_01785 [Chloroflexi bacterium]|nr:hypothetical protein [Chloroflexota bacterium]MDQ3406837.1 hypothetical protein [Chloroflexota bacterium]
MATQDERGDFNEEDLYDRFPSGADDGFGPEQGFDTCTRINDRGLFTDEALQDPAIAAFVDAPIQIYYYQSKSSHRESEYFIHKPLKALTGQVDGIRGRIEGIPEDAHIVTLVLNHERTLAWRITRTIAMADGHTVGQMIHKEGDGSS